MKGEGDTCHRKLCHCPPRPTRSPLSLSMCRHMADVGVYLCRLIWLAPPQIVQRQSAWFSVCLCPDEALSVCVTQMSGIRLLCHVVTQGQKKAYSYTHANTRAPWSQSRTASVSAEQTWFWSWVHRQCTVTGDQEQTGERATCLGSVMSCFSIMWRHDSKVRQLTRSLLQKKRRHPFKAPRLFCCLPPSDGSRRWSGLNDLISISEI